MTTMKHARSCWYLHESTAFQRQDTVNPFAICVIVGCDQHAATTTSFIERNAQRIGSFTIQMGEWLVEQPLRPVACECARQCDALQLSARPAATGVSERCVGL